MSSGALARTGDVRVYRQPGGRSIAVVFFGLAVLWACTATFNIGDPIWWERVVNLALALLLLATCPAQWSAGVTVGPVGVFGRTQLGRRNVRLSWPEVHHFEMRGNWKGVCAITLDGQAKSVMVFGLLDSKAHEVVWHLEDYRWQRQHALGLL